MAVPDVVVVDHHDSYTWNLVHLVAAVTGRLPRVVQHDEVDAADVLRHSHVILSPGPGHPDDPADFAVGREVLRAATRPVLGVCLGMQGLVTAYGGTVDRDVPAHGEVARISHDGEGVFRGLPQDFAAVRYHSLAAVALPDDAGRDGARGRVGRGDGGAARRPAAGGRAVPPGVDPVRARRGDGRQLPGAVVSPWIREQADPVAYFLEVAARHPRCFWLDGGGAREWSGRRSLIGWLDDDDVSLTYDAARGEVMRHAGGVAEVVGGDVFAALEAEIAAGTPTDHWFGYLGYACRPDLPAATGGGLPDAVWMRAPHVRLFDHPVVSPGPPIGHKPHEHAPESSRFGPATASNSTGPPPPTQQRSRPSRNTCTRAIRTR